jgi:two-component system, chemotaxis family, chemotaxis protein CheY
MDKSDFQRIKILIVDDISDIRELLKLYLMDKFDCDVFTAGNGQEALNIINEEDKPDLILLDLMMPVMDGYEFLQKIRTNQETKEIPVIICSTLGEKKIVKNILLEGVTDYILKPINLSLIYHKITKFLVMKNDPDFIEDPFLKKMEFTLDSEGIGYFYSEPFNSDFNIKIVSVDGAPETDIYFLEIGSLQAKLLRVSDNPIIRIPNHGEPLQLTFKFVYTKNRIIKVFFEIVK